MLRVDFEGANGCIVKMGQFIEEMKANASEIDSLMTSELGNYWEGDSYNNCIDTYTSEYQNFLRVKVPEMVKALQQYMETCKKTLQEADQQLAGR